MAVSGETQALSPAVGLGLSRRRLPGVDERQGLEHDYTRRSGVLHTELVLPEGAGQWSRAGLWNAAEKAEKRKDAPHGAGVGSRPAG